MKLLYKFTDDEKKLVQNRYQKYLDALGFIGEVHNLTGKVTMADDFSGLVDTSPQDPLKPTE